MITDAAWADRIMASLERSASYAVLHGEQALAEGRLLSDIDVVTDASPRTVVRNMIGADPELRLLCLWNYDRGSFSSFWSDRAGEHHGQLDISFDPAGQSKYGFRTGRALQTAQRGRRWVRVDAGAEFAYKLSKRLHKGGFDELISDATPEPNVLEFLTERRSRAVQRAIADRASQRRSRRSASDAIRLINRTATPVGTWAHINAGSQGSTLGRTIVASLDKTLPYVRFVGSDPTPRDIAQIHLLRMRPSLVISAGLESRWRPDLVVGLEDAMERLMDGIHSLNVARHLT